MRSRNKQRVLGRAVVSLAACLVFSSGSAMSQEPLKDVKIAVGGANFLDASYYWLMLPGPLGYWEEEGYKAEIFPTSGSPAQQLATNSIDFAQMGASVIIQADTGHSAEVRALINNFTLGWGIAVKKDGPIETVDDFKGKSVGTVAVSTGGTALFKAFLKRSGVDDKDVTLIATGTGAQALLALQNDDVQGLLYWPSALVGFQNADPDLEIMRDPAWATMPDFSLSTNQKTIDEKPEMVTGISRGIAKAMVFAAANPACALEVIWTNYPDTKPTGVDEETAVANNLAVLDVLLKHQTEALDLMPDRMIGASTEAMGAYQDFLFDVGVIARKVDARDLVISSAGFMADINDFDKAAIEADAEKCDF